MLHPLFSDLVVASDFRPRGQDEKNNGVVTYHKGLICYTADTIVSVSDN